jgi:hypothetical protein
MLRRSRINPKLSAYYTQIFGVFYYNQTPLAPIGTRTVVHLRTTQKGRTTFSDHGIIGWTIEPAMDHYIGIGTFTSPKQEKPEFQIQHYSYQKDTACQLQRQPIEHLQL